MPDPGVSDTHLKVANAALGKLGSRDIQAFDRKTSVARAVSDTYRDTLEAALSAYPWRFARATKRIYEAPRIGANAEWEYAFRWPPGALLIHEVWARDGLPVSFDLAFDDRDGKQGRRILTNHPPEIGTWHLRNPTKYVGDDPRFDADDQGQADVQVLPSEEVKGDQISTVDGDPIVRVADRSPCLSAEATVMVEPAMWPGHFRKAFITQLAADLAMPITSDHGLKTVYVQEAATLWAYAKSRDAQARTQPKIDTAGILRVRMGGSFSRRRS